MLNDRLVGAFDAAPTADLPEGQRKILLDAADEWRQWAADHLAAVEQVRLLALAEQKRALVAS